jgi:hypothetical protein
MKISIAIVLLLISLLGYTTNNQNQKETTYCTNPVMWADLPDMSICRHGSDFFISSAQLCT